NVGMCYKCHSCPFVFNLRTGGFFIMFEMFVNAEGGLTTAGYAVTVVAGIVLFLAAWYLAGRRSAEKKMSAKQLVFCGVAIALAYITSYIKIFNMPWGGSITLCSMLFIVLVANW